MKFKEDFSNKELKNRFLFDYLTFNIKGATVLQVLQLLCNSISHNDINVNTFDYFITGALTSYNRSLRFMSERFITINWREYTDEVTGEVIDLDERQGISVNITGTGCRFITEKDFYNLFKNLKSYEVNFTRLDIAFDDFEEVLPASEMINCIRSWTSDHRTVSTMAKFKNSRIYLNRSSKGFSSENFDLGSNGSSRKLRLYDKMVEQDRDDILYWKRLELQLRREKAAAFVNDFLLTKSIACCYANYLSDFVRFLVNNNYGGKNSDKVETAPFWLDFLELLKSYEFFKSDILGIDEDGEDMEENNSSTSDNSRLLTMRQVLKQSAEHLAYQFATSLAFFRKVDPDLYFYIIEEGNFKISDPSCNSKYRRLYEKWKNGDLNMTSLVKVS